jgi:hypothetical protein
MTEPDHGRDDQRASTGPAPDSFATPVNAPPPRFQPPYPQPGYGYPPPPPKPRRAAWIVAGVVALVIVLGVGVAIGVVLRQSAGQPPKPATPAAAPVYSMNAVSNACDLVDPTPLTTWSPTPDGPPQHREIRPDATGAGSLSCQLRYTSDNAVNTAEIIVDAEFTNGSAGPSYDNWQRGDAAKTGVGKASGPVTGVGAKGYWHTEVFGDLVTDTRYLLAVLDGNVSVRVRLNVSRDRDDSQVHNDELESIAKAEARKALNGLRQK